MYYPIATPPGIPSTKWEALLVSVDSVLCRIVHGLQEATGTHKSEWDRRMVDDFDSETLVAVRKLRTQIISDIIAADPTIPNDSSHFRLELWFLEHRRQEWLRIIKAGKAGVGRMLRPYSDSLVKAYLSTQPL